METKSTTQAKYADGVNLVPHHLTQLYTIDQLNDILQTYNPKTVGAPDHATLMKRVHSKAHHDERKRCEALGMREDEKKMRMSRAADALVTHWKIVYAARDID